MKFDLIMKEPNHERNLFEILFLRNKEGIILFDNNDSWRAALSRDFIVTLRSMLFINNELITIDYLNNFFKFYILNWDNNININHNILDFEVEDIKNQFIEWFVYPNEQNSFARQVDFFLQNNIETTGAYIHHNPPFFDIILIPWNNQITINDCLM